MNKKQIITLSFLAALVVSTAAASAETAIYTDGIGRMHFLGKDPASNIDNKNYSNPEQQDLTRRLYEGTTGETKNVDYKFKDYDNTFGIGKMDTQTMWKNKFSNDIDGTEAKTTKGSMTYTKGAKDYYSGNAYGSTNMDTEKTEEANVIKDTTTKKTRWWQRKK